MEQSIQTMVEEINRLYHRIITNNFSLAEKERFVILVESIKGMGYRFKVDIPNVDFRFFELNTNETKLFVRLKIIQFLKLDARSEELFWFSTYMRDAERHLTTAIYVSLCIRGILDKQYFQIGIRGRIKFRQSGNAIDIYPLFNTRLE